MVHKCNKKDCRGIQRGEPIMWIRSQDRAKLIDANEIHIELWADERSYVISDNFVLARYSSEQKALKVMDMIQKQICFCTESYTEVKPVLRSDPFDPYWKKCESVFNMPQDDEVKA